MEGEVASCKQSACSHLQKSKSKESPSAAAGRHLHKLPLPEALRCCSGGFRVKPEGLYLNESAAGKRQIHVKIQQEKTCFLRPVHLLHWKVRGQKHHCCQVQTQKFTIWVWICTGGTEPETFESMVLDTFEKWNLVAEIVRRTVFQRLNLIHSAQLSSEGTQEHAFTTTLVFM